jgi:hypothetical protein
MRHAIPLLILLAAGCANEATGPSDVQPGTVFWLEWPAGVTATAPGRIRVIGPDNNCGGVRFDVSAGPQRVTVQPTFVYANQVCRFAPGASIVATSYDTLLPLPGLDAAQGLPAWYVVGAPVFDQHFGGTFTRAFGFLELDALPDAMTVVAGRATLLADSIGCAWARVEAWGPRQPPLYVVENPPDLGAAALQSAFVGGHFVPASPARCGHASVLHLDFAEIDAALP